jgi:enoyl-CoA hydratase/carnithine racemase
MKLLFSPTKAGGRTTKEREPLLVSQKDGICTLTINRPEKRNALTPEILDRLYKALKLASEDRETMVVVLRGAGDKAFSAGFDVSLLEVPAAGGNSDPMADMIQAIENTAVPVIAMIHGYCIGGGCGLAVACDFRLADSHARLGITAAKLGIVFPPSVLQRLINVVGVPAAKDLLLTARLIDAEEAGRIRLVDHVVPAEKLASVTYDLARQIAANSTLSVRGTKKLINKLLGSRSTKQAWQLFIDLQKQVAVSPDYEEGKKAFLEKRKPTFKKR